MSYQYKQSHPDFGKCPIWICLTLHMTLEKRKAESAKIMDRYQDRIPVICEKSETSKLPDIDKTK